MQTHCAKLMVRSQTKSVRFVFLRTARSGQRSLLLLKSDSVRIQGGMSGNSHFWLDSALPSSDKGWLVGNRSSLGRFLQLFVKSGLYLFMLTYTSFTLQCADQHGKDEIHILAQKAFSCSTSCELKCFFVWFYFISFDFYLDFFH